MLINEREKEKAQGHLYLSENFHGFGAHETELTV